MNQSLFRVVLLLLLTAGVWDVLFAEMACRVVTVTNQVAGAAVGTASQDERMPAILAPAYREFEAKCRTKTATRADLIALKRFIAASAVDGAVKTNVIKRVRKIYQESKKRK